MPSPGALFRVYLSSIQTGGSKGEEAPRLRGWRVGGLEGWRG